MAIHTLFVISRPGIKHRPMRQHGASFIRNIENISMAFQALVIRKRSVCLFSLFFVVICFRPLGKMAPDILYAMSCLCIEKAESILRGRQVAVHAIRHKSLGIVDMGGRFPGIVSKLDFMARCAKLRCRCPDHGVIRNTENGKTDDNTDADKDRPNDVFFHNLLSTVGLTSILKGKSFIIGLDVSLA